MRLDLPEVNLLLALKKSTAMCDQARRLKPEGGLQGLRLMGTNLSPTSARTGFCQHPEWGQKRTLGSR